MFWLETIYSVFNLEYFTNEQKAIVCKACKDSGVIVEETKGIPPFVITTSSACPRCRFGKETAALWSADLKSKYEPRGQNNLISL